MHIHTELFSTVSGLGLIHCGLGLEKNFWASESLSGLGLMPSWPDRWSQNKTKCNPPAHPTWKCRHTNLWIAILFHLTEGLFRSFKRCRLWKEPVVVVLDGSEKNHMWCVATGMSGKQCHSKCSEWPPSALIHVFSLFRHCSVAVWNSTLVNKKPLPASLNMSISAHMLLLWHPPDAVL